MIKDQLLMSVWFSDHIKGDSLHLDGVELKTLQAAEHVLETLAYLRVTLLQGLKSLLHVPDDVIYMPA